MPMLEEKTQPEVGGVRFEASLEQKQRRQMLVALGLLLFALVAVFVKDREFWQQFWFPSAATIADSEPLDQSAPDATVRPQTGTRSGHPVAGTPAKPRQHPVATVAAASGPQEGLSPVITNRAVLPPLEVEVVAGDEHRTIRSGNSSVKLDLQPRAPITASQPVSPAATGGVPTATASVRLSPGTAQIVSRPVDPNYPLLAKQMKVQGSVVLQALIGRDGNIQDLQVLSGPAILSTAAREAVKQWRFRPYFQAGQPVETEARITVNFTISTQ